MSRSRSSARRKALSLVDHLARANPDYVASLYEQFRKDPKSVDEPWRLVFAGYEFGLGSASGTAGGVESSTWSTRSASSAT
jgi:2-oxoglutarate dehydrogenase complex dehydrogenase (E1) component-like enzyme